jgi:hypothetical protein
MPRSDNGRIFYVSAVTGDIGLGAGLLVQALCGAGIGWRAPLLPGSVFLFSAAPGIYWHQPLDYSFWRMALGSGTTSEHPPSKAVQALRPKTFAAGASIRVISLGFAT